MEKPDSIIHPFFFFPGRSRVAGRGGCRRKAAEVALRGSGRSRSSAQAPASPFPPGPRSPTGRVLSTQMRDNPGLGRGQGARGGGQRRAGHDPGTSCGKASGASHVELLTSPWTSPCSRASSQTQRCKGFVPGQKKKRQGIVPSEKCQAVGGSCRALGAPWMGTGTRGSTGCSLSHSTGANPAQMLPHRGFKTCKRQDLL